MKNFIYLFWVILLSSNPNYTYAQQPTIQDCFGAINVCNGSVIDLSTITGEGSYPNEINNMFSCLNSGEANSIWIKFTILDPGLLGIKLTPNADSDIDFALFNLSNATCSDISIDPTLEVSCNFSGSTFPEPSTGLSSNFSSPQMNPMIPVTAGETFYLLVNNFAGTHSGTVSIDFSESTCLIADCNNIFGNIYLNTDLDCSYNSDDYTVPFSQVGIRNIGNNYVYNGYSDENGNFVIQYPLDFGNYEFIYNYNTELFNSCNFPAPFTNFGGSTAVSDSVEIGLASLISCTQLNIAHSANILRPCRTNYRHIQVKNEGTQVAVNPLISVDYNPLVIPLSANYPFTVIGDSVVFQLPSINPFASIQILVLDSVSCDAVAGDLICMNAETNIENTCPINQANGNYSVRFDCLQNKLIIKNENNTDLTSFCYYYSIDTTLGIVNYGYFNISFGDSLIRYFYLEENEAITLFIQNELGNLIFNGQLYCTNQDTVALSNDLDNIQFSNSTNCEIIRNSYDPNDKTGFPAGISEENVIMRNQEIKYRIRFQNTGNDTAFVVIIRDTLEQFLNPSSVRVGMSSHAYTFAQEGNKMAFTFNNILLPDSTTNEPASHGFVDFFVKQNPNNPPNYFINNTAHIYFDFNDAIVTNTYTYEVKEIGVGMNKIEDKKSNLFFPNPSNGILYTNSKLDKNVHLNVYNLQGNLVVTVFPEMNKNTFDLPNTLVNGIYFLVSTSKDISPQKIILNR
jgi:uncharacterized repeat protein (TIGR01451 family)